MNKFLLPTLLSLFAVGCGGRIFNHHNRIGALGDRRPGHNPRGLSRRDGHRGDAARGDLLDHL